MENRIFEFDNCDGGSSYEVVSVKDIENQYNIYGFYCDDEALQENLDYYKAERNEAFEDWKAENDGYTLSDVKCFIEEFIEDFSYYPSGKAGGSISGKRPVRLVECKDEDCVTSTDGYFYEDGTAADPDGIEFYSYWDGSNWKEVILDSEYNSLVSEVTVEYGAFENWIEFGHDQHATGTTKVLFDKESTTFFHYETSRYQGTRDKMVIIGDEEALSNYKFGSNEDLDEYFLNLVSDDAVGLKKGEKIFVDGESLCFSYRDEEYHLDKSDFENKEGNFNGYSYEATYSLNDAIEKARKAIRKRREERILEEYARDNYRKVDTLPLKKIFVEYSDSIEAGNCEAHSIIVKKAIADAEGIKGNYAFRADLLLSYRDDSYSRRAILQAWRSHYKVAN
jgi:hypothetical protein